MPGESWHSVYGFGVLLIECKSCGRRGAIDKEGIVIKPPGSFHGDRRILSDIWPAWANLEALFRFKRSGNPPY
jgi:hypothetical protein